MTKKPAKVVRKQSPQAKAVEDARKKWLDARAAVARKSSPENKAALERADKEYSEAWYNFHKAYAKRI